MSRRSSLILALLLCGSAHADKPRKSADGGITIQYSHMGWDHIKVDRSIPTKDKAFASWRTALGGALTGLLPSDGLKFCHSHTDDYPSFVIRLPDPQGGTLELRSASNCGLYAPWNVVRGGKLWVQTNGKLGEALLPLLKQLDAKVFARGSGKLEEVELAGGDVPAGVKAQTAPWQHAVDVMVAGPAFQAAFKGRAASVDSARCQPSKSPDCGDLTLIVNVQLAPRVSLGVNVTVSGGLASFTPPSGAAALTAMQSGKLFQKLVASREGDVLISLQTSPACDKWPAYQKGRAQHPGAPTTCTAYRIAAPGEKYAQRPFYLYFFPDLGLTWVDPTSIHPDDFLTSVGASADQVASVRMKLLYLDAGGTVTLLDR